MRCGEISGQIGAIGGGVSSVSRPTLANPASIRHSPVTLRQFCEAVSESHGDTMHLRLLVVLAAFLISCAPARAQLEQIGKALGLGSKTQLGDTKIASGLKEALKVGAENAVKLTGKTDGYYRNEAIKILLPKNLRTMERGLRAVGGGQKVDEFELSMNRAAESAAPEARKIFADAILKMTIDDARKILNGGDTAATDYFKSKTTGELTLAFRPIVERSMDKFTVTQQWNALVGQFRSIPFAKNPSLDINQYVVGKALDGLFFMLGQEEKKIRTDPTARVTTLLKEVFTR